MITAKNLIEIPEVNKYFGDKFIKPKWKELHLTEDNGDEFKLLQDN